MSCLQLNRCKTIPPLGNSDRDKVSHGLQKPHQQKKTQTLFMQKSLKKRGAKDTRGTIKNKLAKSWLKKKKTNRQIIVHINQHRKIKTKQHELQ